MGGDCIHMSRYFISDDNIFEDKIIIKGEDVNHIKNVLRCKVGDMLVLSNGDGIDFQVRIDSFEQRQIITKIENVSKSKTEPPLSITLFQGIPKGNKMDFIVQKSVELGIKRIVPIITERTISRFSNEKDKAKKALRWQRIALEAAKQCNRSIIPKVDTPMNFTNIMNLFNNFDFIVLPYEMEKCMTLENSIREIKADGVKIKSIGLIIGPEGGFSEEEVDEAVNRGAKSVTLGPRILRTETAGLAVLAVLMYEFGDFGHY